MGKNKATQKVRMTKHFQKDRINRAVFIGMTIGFGDIVHQHIVNDEHGTRLHCATNTGVDIIKTSDGKTIITAYIMTVSQLKRLFDNEGIFPCLYSHK